MSSQTEANQTATEESAGDPSRWSLTPFLYFVCRSTGFTGNAARLALNGEVVIGRQQPGSHEDIAPLPEGARWELDDKKASRKHARIFLDGKTWRFDDLDSKNGSFVNGERVRSISLRDGDWIRIGSAFFLFRIQRASCEVSAVSRARLDADVGPFATLSPPLESAFEQLAELAPTRLPILIRGETGSGKELVANEVHTRSGRQGKFIAVNCGAIPETLIESELFGHKKGAFSGATDDRLGLVRAADGGTLFLDEIGELSEGSQVALLRVLQEREVRPVGATSPRKVDVRIVAATHQDLPLAVEGGRFRDDLYARLAGHVFELPPLRQRREDLGVILGALARRHRPSAANDCSFSNRALYRLLEGDYPHNVRELEHVIARALALAGDDQKVSMQHIPESQSDESAQFVTTEDAALAHRLRDVLQGNGGNIAATGRAFGKAPMQIRRWCRRFDIDYRKFR